MAGLIALMAVAPACSTARKPHTSQAEPTSKSSQGDSSRPTTQTSPVPSEVFGPPVPPPNEPPPTAYGPDPIQIRPIVLVFGPGLARGYAYVGVLRALHEEKIPIGAIVGTEMGALIGSFYAMEGNINQFEWALLRLKEDTFVPGNGFLKKLFDDSAKGEKLEMALEQVFGTKDLSESKLPLRVALQTSQSGPASIVDNGNAAEVIRASVADPTILIPGVWKGAPAFSASKSRPFAVLDAKALGIGPVVVVDVVQGPTEKQAPELAEADLIIRPNMKGIGPMDFQKRTDAAFRGKKAILEKRAEIRQWVGLPRSDSQKEGLTQ